MGLFFWMALTAACCLLFGELDATFCFMESSAHGSSGRSTGKMHSIVTRRLLQNAESLSIEPQKYVGQEKSMKITFDNKDRIVL
jgi:hypothetical protein